MGQKLKCKKCNDIIESKHVHDFVRCKCGAIFVDGGDEYCRFGGLLEDMDWVEEEDEEEDDFPNKKYDDYSKISSYF